MKVKVIGCGNAFSKLNYNQCFLLEENGRKMLIDCGAKIPQALDNAGLTFFDIDDIYISHQHGDHIGGLEEVAFTRYDWMGRPVKWDDYKKDDNLKKYAIKLYAQKSLLGKLWYNSLSGGLESMEGFDATMETFFETVPVDRSFKWQGWECELIQQVHIMTGSRISPTFGLIMSKNGHKTIYFTTDSQHVSPKQVKVFYTKADVIFQDCECLPFKSGVHANYTELAGYPEANAEVLPREIREKMWLSHYQDFVSQGVTMTGEDCNWETKAEEDGFLGFVEVGQDFEF